MWPYLFRYIFSPSQIDIFRLSIKIYLSAHNDLFLRKTILTCVHIVLYILYCIGTLELKFGRKGSANKKHLVIILHTFKCSCRNVMILDLWTWLPLYCALCNGLLKVSEKSAGMKVMSTKCNLMWGLLNMCCSVLSCTVQYLST